MITNYHEPVMLSEVIKEIPKGKVIDCTLGTGGHSEALIAKGCQVLGIEADPKIAEIAKGRLGDKLVIILGNFSNIERIAKENDFDQVDGILFDLGVSNLHLKNDDRGFSFTEGEQELDMRLNPESQGVKASDLLNALNIGGLKELFEKVMNPFLASKWAKAIINNRPFKTVDDLKKIAYQMEHKAHLDSATLPMLALRIAVNSEYENLEVVLPKAFSLLKQGGKLLVITFHSGEEKILDNVMKTKGFVYYPTEIEVRTNPRSRSAKLHVYEKKY